MKQKGNANQPKTLKNLQVELHRAEIEQETLKNRRADIQRQLDEKEKQIIALREQLEAMKQDSIQISEHAIIRYLERIEGINIEEIKKKILDDQTRKACITLGDGNFPVNNNHFVVVKNKIVVTILPIEK